MTSEMMERVAQAICGDNNPAYILEIHRHRARAAIEAMREPTEAMISVMCNGHNFMAATERDVLSAWRSMIDEALKVGAQ